MMNEKTANLLALFDELIDSLSVKCEIGIERIMFLEKPLHTGHILPEIVRRENLLLLIHPRFLLLHFTNEDLKIFTLAQFLMSAINKIKLSIGYSKPCEMWLRFWLEKGDCGEGTENSNAAKIQENQRHIASKK